jgi:transposase
MVADGRGGELISVVQRRRRWTVEQKLALVEEASRPGAAVSAVAGRHGMSPSLIFDWRRQLREGTMPGVVGTASGASTLVPVRVVDERPAPSRPELRSPARPERSAKAATIEVVLPNGRLLRVPETIRPELLGRLAAALEA